MKIEKINDNQIRCTLSKEDLVDREINLSELAYGTDKAKELFREMMQQASYQYGFEADDIPLMIEAIPLNSENILLIITKVENPEELDTRFSKFTADDNQPQRQKNEDIISVNESASDIIDIFDALKKGKEDSKSGENNFLPLSEALGKLKSKVNEAVEAVEAASAETTPVATVITDLTRLYMFPDLSSIGRVAAVVKDFYHGNNKLYKNPSDHKYYLFISKSDHSPEDFNKVCNIFSEYAHQEHYSQAIEAFYAEHCDLILAQEALQKLAAL